ncbi:hypothetical protein C8Z91_20250 [Paenibacillus elgii]|uniref:Uncharacterized protein n=1 Tax=Paenibacillus elgii TaxID=189691 RepID=A0A2T6FZM0_9BACL|nr:hypothetical protein [Paenibacillus elgii]PUA37358.1 hypothetical protein C8Z91_20250 [Paenibacillus elgii]
MSLWFKEKAVQKIIVVLFVLALSTGFGTKEALAYYTYNCSDDSYTCQGVVLAPGSYGAQTRSIYVKQGTQIEFSYVSAYYPTSEIVNSTTVSLVHLYDGVVSSDVVVPPSRGGGGYYIAAKTGWYTLDLVCGTGGDAGCEGDGYLKAALEP